MTSRTQDFKNLKKMDIFVLLVTFELLSHYPNMIHIIQILVSSHWLRKNIQWITDKVFREKLMVEMASKFSSRTLPNFCFRLFLFLFS